MSIEPDEKGLEKAWRVLRNRLGKKSHNSNEELRATARAVIVAYNVEKTLGGEY